MAKEAHAVDGGVVVVSPQKKGAQNRKPSAPREVYALVQVLDEHGTPMEVHRGRVNVISFERNAQAVLDKIDNKDAYPHALYLRGFLPVGR